MSGVLQVRRLDDKVEASVDMDDCHLADDGAEEIAKATPGFHHFQPESR